MKKKDKVEFIQPHIAYMLVDSKENYAILRASVISSEDNDSSDSSDSDRDEIICTTATADELEEHTGEDIIQVERLFRETRSGRTATSWRQYQFLKELILPVSY